MTKANISHTHNTRLCDYVRGSRTMLHWNACARYGKGWLCVAIKVHQHQKKRVEYACEFVSILISTPQQKYKTFRNLFYENKNNLRNIWVTSIEIDCIMLTRNRKKKQSVDVLMQCRALMINYTNPAECKYWYNKQIVWAIDANCGKTVVNACTSLNKSTV